MRLTDDQREIITTAVSRMFGQGSEVWLFGSRMDDAKRGGDVDLLIRTDVTLSLINRARIKMELESLLGLPIDIVSQNRNAVATPFQIIARSTATRLDI
ncbi:MAG TPA: nucleotidyltransferase domain-containing protein [Burkholderiales bacterium]|nr:nucleotidyltransferase domain-containing protein [Burkholderiales bacterium]